LHGKRRRGVFFHSLSAATRIGCFFHSTFMASVFISIAQKSHQERLYTLSLLGLEFALAVARAKLSFCEVRAEREIKISLEHTPAAFGFAIVKVSPAQS
jgi:hypothetical protein